MVARPIVVLVHGAWHGAWCWAPVQAELDRRGVASYALDLPGRGLSTGPLADLDGDADAVSAALDALERDVVLVGHSYGGAVVSACDPGRSTIRTLVYLTAYALRSGESVRDVIRAAPATDTALADAVETRDDGTSVVRPTLARPALYGSCPDAVVHAAVARLGPQRVANFAAPVHTSLLGTVPSVYVRCTRDRAIPIAQQDLMAARCDEVVTLDTDHSPFASATGEVADLIERLTGIST